MPTGEILDEIDRLKFRAGGAGLPVYDPDWLKVPSIDYVVIVFGDSNSEGRVGTVSLDSEGNIGSALIDLVFFENTASGGRAPRLVNLGGTVYFAVVYGGPGGDGWLKTFSIGTDGTISAMIASLEFETSSCDIPDVIHLSGTKYAIVYKSLSLKGRLVTVNIDDDGTNLSIVDGPDIPLPAMANQTAPEIISVSGTIYAIIYTDGADDDIKIKTIDIANNGTIGSVVATATIVALGGVINKAQIVKLTNNNFVIAYKTSAGATYGKSVNISDDGATIGSVLDTKELIATGGLDSISLLQIVTAYFLVASSGASDDGYMYSYSIDSSGVFSDSIDSYKFEAIRLYNCKILFFSGRIHGVLWQGNTNEGWVATFKVQNNASLIPTDPLLRVSGIRRTFWSGLGGQAVYQCELALGGMSITYVSPIGSRDIPSAVTPLTTPAKTTFTPSGEGYRLRDYGVWLSGTTVDIQTRLFGHSPPTYTEWVDWMEAVSRQGYAEWSY